MCRISVYDGLEEVVEGDELQDLVVNAGLGLQRNVDLLTALLRSHAGLTTSRSGIAIPSGGSANFAYLGGIDPTLHLGIESAAEALD